LQLLQLVDLSLQSLGVASSELLIALALELLLVLCDLFLLVCFALGLGWVEAAFFRHHDLSLKFGEWEMHLL
jgi:hypothetical protein